MSINLTVYIKWKKSLLMKEFILMHDNYDDEVHFVVEDNQFDEKDMLNEAFYVHLFVIII